MSTPEGWSFALHTTEGRARRGTLTTPHGEVQTPAFMPVGTRATVKGLMPRDLAATGAEVCLANTYHLHIAPGDKIVKRLGGLHRMMAWDKTILTDSGGFQVFSLPKVQLDEEGVRFRFEKGGESVVLTPERSMAIQNNLGADIIMAFDVCVPFPCDYLPAREAVYRTERWLKRCKEAHVQTDTQALFGIVQGSTYADLRRLSAELTCQIDLPGYAIGGVSVGEGHGLMMDVIDWTEPIMPTDKPRYLMGVGYPEDIIEAVARGIDMFDCVLPSRYGRSGVMFTRKGRLRVTNARYRNDRYPIDTQCQCYACQNFSRGYINHLLNSKEILGSTLGTLHNITFYQDLMRAIRAALDEGTFESFRRAFLAEYLSEDRQEELGLHFVSRGDDDASDDLSWDTEHSVIPPAAEDTPVALEAHQARDAQDDTTQKPRQRNNNRNGSNNRGGNNNRGGGGGGNRGGGRDNGNSRDGANRGGNNSRGGDNNSRGGGGKKGGKKQS